MPGQTHGFAFWKPFHIKRIAADVTGHAVLHPRRRNVRCSGFVFVPIFEPWRFFVAWPEEATWAAPMRVLASDSMLLLSTQNLVS